MRFFLAFLLLIAVLAAAAILVMRSPDDKKTVYYPVERSLTDSQGRRIDGAILGKGGQSIAFRKRNDSNFFIIGVDRLSDSDREFISGLKNSRQFEWYRREFEKQTNASGRTASWNMDLNHAQTESAKLDLPILLTFLTSHGYKSQRLNRNILDTREFRQWANREVVLCRYYTDTWEFLQPEMQGETVDLNSAAFLDDGSEKAVAQAKRFSVSRVPAIVILRTDGTVVGKMEQITTGEFGELIKEIDPLINYSQPSPSPAYEAKVDDAGVLSRIRGVIVSLLGRRNPEAGGS